MKWRTTFGLVLTVAWILGFGAWTLLWEPPVSGNEWGDWAAGMFAPVAFFWLVLGYFQQGEELRDNVRALHLQERALQLQVQELRESVEQQTTLAKASARQAELAERGHDIALRAQLLPYQPRFSGFRAELYAGKKGWCISMSNQGAPISNVRVLISDEGSELNQETFEFWYHDTEQSVLLNTSGAAFPLQRVVRVDYTDQLLIEQSQTFVATATKGREGRVLLSIRRSVMTFNLPISQHGNTLL